ncbi:MAG TPA: hypothetical protein VJ990_09100 [Clostridia bacterium]|nr:hypothetical protein [Clostridia bacterium]
MKEIAYIDRNFAEFIPNFIKDRKKDIADIRVLIGRGDLEGTIEILKMMRETANTFGFKNLTAMSSHAVTVAKKNDHSGIGELTDKMEKYLEHLKISYVDQVEECEMDFYDSGTDML